MSSLATTQVLVIDDEPNIVEVVRGYLEREGFEVHSAEDGRTGLEMARSLDPDLIVLDLMLPGIDGLEVCRQIRQFSDVYVLMLTARTEEMDKIIGLSVGADDYLTKPFSPRELVARVRAMLRRPRPNTSESGQPVHHLRDLVIDSARHVITRDGAVVEVTAREFAVLEMLAEQPGRVFSRAQILEQVWGSEFYDDHVVEVHIGNLRRKLDDDPSRPRYVETVRGLGYRTVVSEK